MESSERKAHVCCDCKARSPETDTNYTLISSRYGWRLSRHVGSDGTFVVEWRCPRCWERYKSKRASLGGPESGRSDSTPPPASGDSPRSATPTSAATGARARRQSSAPPPRAPRNSQAPSLRAAASSSPPARRKK